MFREDAREIISEKPEAALKRMQKTKFVLLTIKVNQMKKKSFDSVVKSEIA